MAGERPDALSPRGHSSAKPVGPQTFKLEVVVSEQQLEKIEAARGLLRHRNPEGDLASIIELAMDVLIAKVEKQRFSVTDRPRKSGRAATSDDVPAEVARQVVGDAPAQVAPPVYRDVPAEGARQVDRDVPAEVARQVDRDVPAEVARQVYARDEGRCTWIGEGGHRCNSIEFVEIDHVAPRAEGGGSTLDNLRLLCRPHNQLAARQKLILVRAALQILVPSRPAGSASGCDR